MRFSLKVAAVAVAFASAAFGSAQTTPAAASPGVIVANPCDTICSNIERTCKDCQHGVMGYVPKRDFSPSVILVSSYMMQHDHRRFTIVAKTKHFLNTMVEHPGSPSGQRSLKPFGEEVDPLAQAGRLTIGTLHAFIDDDFHFMERERIPNRIREQQLFRTTWDRDTHYAYFELNVPNHQHRGTHRADLRICTDMRTVFGRAIQRGLMEMAPVNDCMRVRFMRRLH